MGSAGTKLILSFHLVAALLFASLGFRSLGFPGLGLAHEIFMLPGRCFDPVTLASLGKTNK